MPNATARLPARRRAFALAATCSLAFVLAACQRTPPPPSNATPKKAVATNLRLTESGDFDGLMQNRLPPADYVQWRAEWDKARATAEPASPAQKAQFAKIMQMLTEPGAEAKLAKRLQPELAKLKGGKSDSMPIFSGILEAAGMQMIAHMPQLGPEQRALASQAFATLIAWAKTTDFSDKKKAQKAIALICSTARALHVQTLDQWRALDYTTTMKNYGIIWNGLEQLLDLYGLDLARSLAHADITTTQNNGTHATIKLDMTLAGKSLTSTWPMLMQGNHWYDAALLDAWRTAHPAAATSTAAAAATTAAPATTTGAAAASTSAPTTPRH